MGPVMAKVKGGKTVYGACLGILMLETQFPRIPGDIGNALTFPFPVRYRVVRGASPDRVVRRRAEGLLPAFIDAARELVADGADGITTNCGFLSVFQNEIADAVEVPVATSSLMQVPLVRSMLPAGRTVGVLTISVESLSEEHLQRAGVPAGLPVVGTDGGREFTRAILNDEPELDVDLARSDVLDAGARLVSQNPEVGAIVLECTNMVPYATDLRVRTGVPVFGIYSFLRWFHEGLVPRRFDPLLDDPRSSFRPRPAE